MSRHTDNRDYHSIRAEAELRRAEEAKDPIAVKAHRELATLHRRQLLEGVDQRG